MTTTYQTIIDNGFAKSSAARPETLNSPAELVARINQCLLEAFQVMSREQPVLLGTSVQVSWNGSGWSRPSNCLRAIKIVADATTIAVPVLATGTEIKIVPFDDPLFCAGQPSVTEFAQAFMPVGQSMDPSSGTLRLYYARSPVLGTLATDTIDVLFPEPLNDFLQCDMAAYLATKDRRQEDVDAFLGLKGAMLSQLIDWCRQQTYSLQQRFPLVSPPLTNTNSGRAQPGKGS